MSITTSVPLSRITVASFLFLFTLLSGLWLSYLGKPFNSLIFTIHKLIAVATIIVIGVNIYRLQQALDTGTLAQMGIMAVTGLLFLALVVSGSLLSLKLTLPATVLKIHQVAPLLALLGTTATVYLLLNGRS